MTSQVIKSTFASTYNDDYRDSDNYHRILFNSGRALQARELTQLQTIIQSEVERLGKYLFKESSIITGNLGSAQMRGSAIFFAKLNTSVNSLPSNYTELNGAYFTNAAGLRGIVKKIIPAENSDPATILYSIVDGADEERAADSTLSSNFQSGDNITIGSVTLSIQTINTVANPALGRASIIDVPETETFTAGHFVFTPAQTLVLDKYTSTPTDTLVYKVTEDIVTASDDQALYDNAGSTPNLTSPGADRYRIRLTLDLLSNISGNTTYIPLINIKNGITEPLQFPDSILNELGDLIAQRTYDMHGDFVVNDPLNRFQLSVEADSDDDYLNYRINPGTAFIGGYRFEREQTTTIRVKKPRTAGTDIYSVTNENVTAEYGNYFLADSAYGLLDKTDNLDTINLYDKKHKAASSTVLGTARIKNIEKNAQNNYKFYMFDITMDSNGSGILYDIADTKSIGEDSSNYANLLGTENKVQLLDPGANTNLFKLPLARTQELAGTINLTVKDVYTATTNGAGEAVFNTAAVDEDFADESEWLLSYDSGGEILSTFNIASGGAGNTSVTIDGLNASKGVKLLCYVNTSATIIPKSELTKTESLSIVNNVLTLTEPDFTSLTSVVDDNTSEDITYKFSISQGPNDNGNFYQPTKLKLSGGFTAPSGTVTVVYKYLSSSASGDFYGVNSYNSISYSSIPRVGRASGATSLADVLDFRSVKNSSGGWDRIVRVPRNRDIVTIGTANYFSGRSDLIYMNSKGFIDKKLGNAGTKPVKRPELIPYTLPLHYVDLAAYTYNVDDLTRIGINQSSYKMSDIRRLENRINNVEYLTSLTISELNLSSLSVIDENGLERTKVGIFADNFREQDKSLVAANFDYRAAAQKSAGILRPRALKKQLEMYYDSDQSSGVVRKGATVWPKYDEEVFISQTIASNPINVNQTQLSVFNGSLQLTPDGDTWTEERTLDGNNETIAIHGDLSQYDESPKEY